MKNNNNNPTYRDTSSPSEDNQATKITHKVDSLTVYEVKEEELEIIKKWPANRYPKLFEFGVFFLWISVTTGINLFAMQNLSGDPKIIHISILVSSIIISLILFFLYFTVTKEDAFSEVIKTIIGRKK